MIERMRGITIAALILATASCTRIVDDPTVQPSGSSPGPGVSPTETGVEVQARIFFVIEQRDRLFLVPESRSIVEASPGVGRMMELIVGQPHDPDLSSPWPTGARVLGVTIEHGTAIVDFSADVLTASVGADQEAIGIHAAAHTLVEMPGVERVQFTVEGKASGDASNGRRIDDWWGHVGLGEQPFEPDDELLAPVTIDQPQEGETVARTVTVSGEASVFEANVIIRVRDADGEIVQRTFATASIGAPARGTWEKRLTLPQQPGEYTIEAVEDSEEDGSDLFVMTRVVTLA